jgi:putative flippase GtrA
VTQSGLAEEFGRLARFSAVGAIAAVGAMISFDTACMVSYFGHFRFTFAASGRYRDHRFWVFL